MRLFLAVDLTEAARGELGRAVGHLREAAPDAKWVPTENLHLTLVFLGEVAEGRTGEIVRAVADAVGNLAPVRTALAGIGSFPRATRARVLWVGLRDEAGALGVLASACMDALEPLGFPRESRPWTPHLTLARFRVPSDVSRLPPVTIRPMEFVVEAATLFRSQLARPAPRYEAIYRIPLGASSTGSARPAGT